MPQGNCACDRVAQSDSSISGHIPKLCLSLTDSVDNVSYKVYTETCVCQRKGQESLCKHYLLSAQYRFLICNRLVVGYCVCTSTYNHNLITGMI